MADKAKNERLMSPMGVAQYAWLNRADTKYKEHGEYKVTLRIPKDEAKDFIMAVTKIHKEYAASEKQKKLAPLPITKELDDNDKPTGNVLIKFTSQNKMIANKAKGKGEPAEILWDRKPVLFDAKGHPSKAIVGSGSKLKISTEVYTWNTALGAGVTLQINAVQILELVEYTAGASAEKYGFEVEEGYEAGEEENGMEDGQVSPESEDEDLF